MQLTFPLLFSVVVFGVFFCAMIYFKWNPFRYGGILYEKFIEKIANTNIKKSVKNIKKSKITQKRKSVLSLYGELAKRMILDYNLPITIEGFNSMIAIVLLMIGAIVFLVIQNITIAFLIAISIVIAGFTYFIMQARIAESKKIEAIMDVEDLICPLAREGVMVAIKKVLENRDFIASNIRPYFVQFVDNCENLGYSFKKAMEILNRQLGKKFDNFSEKAIVFEQNERKGMADIFLDIVDENAALREVNARKNRAFRKMNREFIIKASLIGVFVMYSLLGAEYRSFMLGTDMGKTLNGIVVIAICLSFARIQMLQRDIN